MSGEKEEKERGTAKHRGAPYGNKNCAGHRNAAGKHNGGPYGNKNAEKEGAYSKVDMNVLTDGEKKIAENTPLESKAALEEEMKLLKVREYRILERIAAYENAPEDDVFLNSVVDMGKAEMRNKESAFNRVLKLHDALYRVQGRIAKIADSIRNREESEKRLELERQRLDIMRMRATGAVEVEYDNGTCDE